MSVSLHKTSLSKCQLHCAVSGEIVTHTYLEYFSGFFFLTVIIVVIVLHTYVTGSVKGQHKFDIHNSCLQSKSSAPVSMGRAKVIKVPFDSLMMKQNL